ncbi:MAG: CBS domain-containing protein [bacterium]|nr:CBS domain-containing protein [bacterium]
MESVRTLLEEKGHDVWSIAPEGTAYDALRLMAEKKIGAVVVVDGEKPVGVFSERDYARGIVLKEGISRSTPVKEFMSDGVFFVQPDQSVDECMSLMTDKHLRHLPVMEGDRLVGMISISDVVRAVISKKDLKMRHLHNQIVGYDSFHRM